MLRMMLGAVAAVCLTLGGTAQESSSKPGQQSPPAKPAKPEISLKIGDPAPKLKVTKWIKGDAVNGFEPGKLYVVEFWATWCGPCIASMPHLTELQAEYRDKGLTIASLTSRDPNNSEKQVDDFVKNRGAIMGYNVAWCEDRAMKDAYLAAAGQNGIPCAFVVDQQGKIAFIGHPLILDEVLPKIVEGSWKGETDAQAATETLNNVFKTLQRANQNPEEGLKAFADQETQHPQLMAQFSDQKLMLLLRGQQMEKAEQLFQGISAKATKNKDAMKLASISRIWSEPSLNPEKRNIKLAVSAVEEAQKLAGPKDLGTLLAAAQVYDAAGNKTKAGECADKAIDAASNEQLKERIKQMVQKYKN
jgi:thiol-disulfide isomerase/thioredoxin